jgi:RNA polymerase sigma factor (sigma-70 family)
LSSSFPRATAPITVEPTFLSDLDFPRVFNGELKMTDSPTLLADYVKNGSDPAFRELVTRYLNLVHSAAIRLVGGDAHLAEDVAQTVFVDLARMAGGLSSEVMLGGWLHRHTCYVAAKTMRTERRRQSRERQAVAMYSHNDHSEANLAQLTPFLDDAINRLGARDRTAIMLRFFEQRDLRSVGEALGSNEDAAQKRVARALEKLRALLKKRGVALSVAALGTALSTDAVTAAPAGLAASVCGVALAGAAAGGGAALASLKLMSLAKLKLGLLAAIAIATVATPLVLQHRSASKLREEISSLRPQADATAQLKLENERLSNLLAQASDAQSRSNQQLRELLGLRSAAGKLREEQQRLEELRAALAASQGAQVPISATNPAGQPAYPKESWAFVGRATPEAALQSLFWAKSQGDLTTIQAGYTPATWAVIQDYFKEHPDEYRGEADLGVVSSNSMRNITAFYIKRKEQLSQKEVSLELVQEGGLYARLAKEGKPYFAPMYMTNIQGEWKLGSPGD